MLPISMMVISTMRIVLIMCKLTYHEHLLHYKLYTAYALFIDVKHLLLI